MKIILSILLIFISVIIFSSCTKTVTVVNTVTDTLVVRDTVRDTVATATLLKKIIEHSPDTSLVDTTLFTYDISGRLASYYQSSIDTALGSSTYYYEVFSFIYFGNSSQPVEYTAIDNEGDAITDLLSYNSSGQLIRDSTIGDGYLGISYNGNLITNAYYYGGVEEYSDSLTFNVDTNLVQWALDEVTTDPITSLPELSQNLFVTYGNYNTNANPLYNLTLNNVAGVLFENTGTDLDPSLLYSKNLPLTESAYGSLIYSYTYSFNGASLQQLTASGSSGGDSFVLNFYY
jgi:hypothetical protein